MLGGAETSLESQAWWVRFKEDLAIAEIKMPAIEILALTVIATAVAVVLITVILGSALFGVLGLIVPFVVRAYLKGKLAHRRKQFADQLPDCLQIISSAFAAVTASSVRSRWSSSRASEPTKSEMARVVQEESLGTPLEDAFALVALRMENSDLDQWDSSHGCSATPASRLPR